MQGCLFKLFKVNSFIYTTFNWSESVDSFCTTAAQTVVLSIIQITACVVTANLQVHEDSTDVSNNLVSKLTD